MKKVTLRHLTVACFAAYCVLMVVLLFGRERYDLGLDYWKTVSLNYNFVPFVTIKKYVGILIHGRHSLYSHAIINLFGNILMFVPMGYLIPMIWRSMRKFLACFAVCVLVIVTVELIQLFTLVGSCDIDDLILNLAGISLGFFLFRLPEWLFKK